MSIAIRAASIAVVLGFVLSADVELGGEADSSFTLSPTAEAKPKKSVKRCVRYKQEKGADELSVDITLSNRCGFPLTCRVSWAVVCDEVAAPATSRGMELSAKERGQINASASSCGEGDWEIADVRWSCDRE